MTSSIHRIAGAIRFALLLALLTPSWATASPLGSRVGFGTSNGTKRVLGYDSGGRLIRIEERFANDRLISMVRLGFDAAGRLNKRFVVPLPSGGSFPALNYTYSADNRINELSHDADGHMLTVRPTPSGSAEPGLDSGGGANVGWDDIGRLAWARKAIGSYRINYYKYDSEGLLIENAPQSNPPHGIPPVYSYTWNPHGLSGLPEMIMSDINEAGDVLGTKSRWYVWGGPAGLLYDVRKDAPTEVRYYHADQVGSTLALTNQAGDLTARFEYTPYGLPTRVDDHDTLFRFNGGFGVMTERETGLLYMRARWYHPWLTRFLNEDPTGFGGGMNMFAFAGGNPLMRLDPTGLNDQASHNGYPDVLHINEPDPADTQATWENLLRNGDIEKLHGDTYSTTPAIDPVDLGVNLLASGARSLVRSEVQILAADEAPQILRNQAAGNAARDAIAASRPGSLIEQNFRVTGGLRRVDVLDGTTAIESKVGRTSLTPAVRQELARDIKMIRSGQVDAVEWHFSLSPTTGLGGPTGPLRSVLEKFGIPIIE